MLIGKGKSCRNACNSESCFCPSSMEWIDHRRYHSFERGWVPSRLQTLLMSLVNWLNLGCSKEPSALSTAPSPKPDLFTDISQLSNACRSSYQMFLELYTSNYEIDIWAYVDAKSTWVICMIWWGFWTLPLLSFGCHLLSTIWKHSGWAIGHWNQTI